MPELWDKNSELWNKKSNFLNDYFLFYGRNKQTKKISEFRGIKSELWGVKLKLGESKSGFWVEW